MVDERRPTVEKHDCSQVVLSGCVSKTAPSPPKKRKNISIILVTRNNNNNSSNNNNRYVFVYVFFLLVSVKVSKRGTLKQEQTKWFAPLIFPSGSRPETLVFLGSHFPAREVSAAKNIGFSGSRPQTLTPQSIYIYTHIYIYIYTRIHIYIYITPPPPPDALPSPDPQSPAPAQRRQAFEAALERFVMSLDETLLLHLRKGIYQERLGP